MRWSLLTLMLVVLFGGCECITDEDVVASIDEPIEARIVVGEKTAVEWEGGPHFVALPTGLATSRYVALRVEGYDQRALLEAGWTEHTAVELVSDSDGKRLAYREKDKSWKVVYLLAKEHVFVTDALYAELDWAKVPDFRGAAPHLFQQAAANRQDCVIEEVEKAGGDQEVARFLVETVAVYSEKAWDEAFAKLPDNRRKEVELELKKHLRADAESVALKRALAHVPLRDPRLAPQLLELVKKLDRKNEDGTALAIAVRASSLLDPPKAAELACPLTALDKLAPTVREEAFFALAHAKSGCAPAEKAIAPLLCDEPLRCLIIPSTDPDDGPCDDSAWGQTFDEIAAADPAAAAGGPSTNADSWRMLARAWVVRTKPALVERVRARLGYRVAGPETPPCHAADKKGESCHCDQDELREGLCRLGDKNEGATEHCAFTIDDKQTEVRGVTASAASKLVALSRGTGHACGIAVDGEVRCWGRFPFGGARRDELGAPAPVKGWSKATLIASGDQASCALAAGKLSCLGVDVGPGTSKYEVEKADKQPAVAPVAYRGKLVGLALAKEHGCALDDGGKVQCWKMTATAVTNAVAVDGLDQVTHIEGGEVAVVAVRRDGSAFELDCKAEPCTAHKVASGDLVQALRQLSECVGVTKGGGAMLWLMAGPKAGALEPIAGLSGVEALAHGGYRTCALSKTHEVSCFARGEAPTRVGLEHVKALSGGGDYVTALLEDGSFVTWKPKDGKPSRNYQ